MKSYKKRGLCPQCGNPEYKNGNVFHLNVVTNNWECGNCSHKKPAGKKHSFKFGDDGLTDRQRDSVERIKTRFFERAANGDKYEIKQLEIKPAGEYSFATVVIEVGMIGDEGTAASLLCRTSGHFIIRVGGSIKCLGLRDGTYNVEKKYQGQYFE